MAQVGDRERSAYPENQATAEEPEVSQRILNHVKGYRAMVRVAVASVHIHCRVVATRCSLSTRGVSAGDDMALGFCSENMMPGY